MAYSDLANNQGVSFNSLISGVSQGYFDAKTTIPSSSQMATKSDCNTYVDIEPSYPPFAVKTDNQLVVKRDLKDNVAVISISNNFFEGTITDVTVNGVSVYGASFPLGIGDSTQGYTDQIGTYDIVLYYADANMPTNYARCYDSNYNTVCVDGFSSTGPGPYYVTFSSQYVSSVYPVSIISGDGGCTAPVPPQIGDQAISCVAVNRGSGQYMAATATSWGVNQAGQAGGVFVSSDYGATWTFKLFINYWSKVTISDNGQYMIATPTFGQAYKSSDYGVNWSAITSTVSYNGVTLTPGSGSFFDTCTPSISGDGQYMILINTYPNGYPYRCVFVSNDYGSSWVVSIVSPFEANIRYYGSSMSSNGAYMFVAKDGEILRSTNYGSSWTSVVADASVVFQDVKCLADGSKVIAAKTKSVNSGIPTNETLAPDYLMTSSNYGSSSTWSNITSGSGSLKAWGVCSINTYNSGTGYGLYDTYATTFVYNPTYIGKTNLSSYSDLTTAGLRIWLYISNSNNGQYVLAGTSIGLFLSNDYGVTFTQIT
jgi:hypothetical protein